MKLHNKDCFDLLNEMIEQKIEVDAIITDPPYGKLKHKIETGFDIPLFFEKAYKVLKKNSFLVFFGMQPTLTLWITEAIKQGFKYKQEVIWYKKRRSSPFGKLGNIHENILCFVKGNKTFNEVRVEYTDIKESLADMTESKSIITRMSKIQAVLKDEVKKANMLGYLKEPKKYFTMENKSIENVSVPKNLKKPKRYLDDAKSSLIGALPTSVVAFGTPNSAVGSEKIKHPTLKPKGLMDLLIDLTTDKNDVVFDPFMGSGTTGVACKDLERNFIGSEIDKDYFDLAKKRLGEKDS